MPREKFNLVKELITKNAELKGKKRLSLVGQGDFAGGNNVMRSTMNIKHHTQHLAIDNPEFPFFYDGKENIMGENSSFYMIADKEYEIVDIVKKYNERLKGKSRIALYFLHCKKDDSYKVIERKSVENLSETYGFDYKNDFLDQSEVGDIIPKNTMVYSSTSYDEYGNASIGVNGRILYAVDPAVQDDAIIVSESFAKKMVANKVVSRVIPINNSTMLLNLYGKDGEYQGLPNIGDVIHNGIICATRGIKETRMFSDLRDISLKHINDQVDHVYYGNGEIIDINIYCNNPNLKMNKVNRQIIEYYNDAKWFYTDVYRACKKIINSGSTDIDSEIHRWMRLAINYLDNKAVWAWNDNVFENLMIEILIRDKEPIKVGRKVTGRAGNKTVVCDVRKDEDMPYLTTEYVIDEHGRVLPKGPIERCDMITNPLAPINRTIPLILIECSVTFILDRARKYAMTLKDQDEAINFLFDILTILNPKQSKDIIELYESLSDREKKSFIKDCISVDARGLLITNNGTYVRWDAFNENFIIRDAIIEVYKKYGDIIKPYHIFVPKPKWGRDIYIGDDCIGYQYMMMLKQSGEKGFSVRSAGSISDESLPEKSNSSKSGKHWASTKPIRFGEYETPNFLIITDPNDFALISALYRSSVDGRRYMYEAIISDDGKYNIPDNFTSRTSEVLQVYFKSLGVRMKTVIDEDEYIGEYEHSSEIVGYEVGNRTIFCTVDEMYYLKKLRKVYRRYLKENPNTIDDTDEVWAYIMDNLPFKKKYLTDQIIETFKTNMEAFGIK